MSIPVNGANVGEVCDKLKAGELPPARSASMRLFTPAGFEVLVPLAESTDFGKLFSLATAASQKALAAGWLAAPVTAESLKSGEETEPVGWVVRTMNQGRNGPTNVLHLYSTNPGWMKPFLVAYLNTADDITAFEAASGLRVTAIPEYVGEGRLERGKSSKTDQLIVAVKKPFAAVYKPNPRYDEAEAKATKAKGGAYTIAKKKWQRWAATGAPQAAAPQPAVGERDAELVTRPPAVEGLVKDYAACRTDEQFAALEDVRGVLWKTADDDEKLVVKGASNDCRKRLAASAEPAGSGGRTLFANPQKQTGVAH